MPLVIAALAPLSLQVANLFFFLAALFSDLLLIRVCLAVAFVALVVLQIQTSVSTGELVADGLLWSTLTGVWHWRAACSLTAEAVRELLAKPAESEADAALWCFLHRRTGMPHGAFQRVRAAGAWRTFAPGELICDTEGSRRSLFLLTAGEASARYTYESGVAGQKTFRSGDLFDYRLLNVLGVFVGPSARELSHTSDDHY